MQFKFGQWVLEVDENGYLFTNPGPNGEKRFYMVRPGQYGGPVIVPEPDLSFPFPVGLQCVDARGNPFAPAEQISGIICKDGPRFSLTNARNKGIEIKVNDDGSLSIGGEIWWIATLFSKDKNRIVNYDGFCVKEKPVVVKYLELGDLDLY